MGVTVAVNLAVAAYSLRAARISGSVAIAADARHLLTNVVQAVAVIVGLALVGITGSHIFDPIVALLLAAYLLWIALGILRAALQRTDRLARCRTTTLARLEECLAHEGHGMRGFHELRTRKSGREKYIDVHVLVDPTLTVSEAHRRVEEIERDMRSACRARRLVHVDPDEAASWIADLRSRRSATTACSCTSMSGGSEAR